MTRRVLPFVLALFVACSQGPAPSPTTDLAPSTTTTTSTTGATTSTTRPGAATGQTLQVGTAVAIETLDPAQAVALAEWELILAIGEGLLVQDPATGEIEPGIAEELPEVSDDGLTYTFRLDPNVEFSDGLELTAPLYARSIERVMSLGGGASDLVTGFVNSVEAPDDETVVFHLNQPFAFFPVVMSGAAYVPVHPDDFPEDRLTARPEAPIHGVGDWYVAEMSEDRIVLERNPNRPTDEDGPEDVVIYLFTSGEEMSAALVDGSVDLLWRGVGHEMEQNLATADGVTIGYAEGGLLELLVMNHGLPPTDDPAVRRALATLVDREMVADEVLAGTVDPAYSPVPAGILGSTESFRNMYREPDVVAAIDLLTGAGYTPEEPARIELAYPPERYGVGIAQAMEELERQIEATGLIDVTLTAQAWNTYVGEVVDGAYNVALLGWVFDFPDPHNYLAPFLLQGGLGGSGVGGSDGLARLVELLEEAAVEPDSQQRIEQYGSLQDLFAEEVVAIPLWVDPEAVAYLDHVTADPEGPNPEALNIGPPLRLDFSELRIDR